MMAAAAPASLAPPVAMGTAAPVKVTIGAADFVVVGATEVCQRDEVGAIGVGVGVTIGAGAEDDQSLHWLLAGAVAGVGTLEDQSFHWLVAGTGMTGVVETIELVQSCHCDEDVVGTTGTTEVELVQSCHCEEDVVGTTGTTGVEVVQSCHCEEDVVGTTGITGVELVQSCHCEDVLTIGTGTELDDQSPH